MRPVDREQLLGDRDQGLGIAGFVQQRFGDTPRPVPQPLALRMQPDIEGRVDPVELFQQLAVKQRERTRMRRGRPQHLVHVDPDDARTQRQAVAVD